MGLQDEIDTAQRLVKTDAYQMSVGEVTSLYKDGELVINPQFQRLFRWEPGQKSRLIESILLGIPIPPIFVFEREDSTWELIDGLQRLSTLLEFMGLLQDENGSVLPPSYLSATEYLPSLLNSVWEKSSSITDIRLDDQVELSKANTLAIRRARFSIEILKRPSDNRTKFDLFQRLNAGGTPANPQELRNSLIEMANPQFSSMLRGLADNLDFRSVLGASEDQIEQQRHMEYASRFLVYTYVPYESKFDVEAYIDRGILKLAYNDIEELKTGFNKTFSMLNAAAGENVLRRLRPDGIAQGRVGLAAFECIAVGVGRNQEAIASLSNPVLFIQEKIHSFWADTTHSKFFVAGLRGTRRLQLTLPHGELHFKP